MTPEQVAAERDACQIWIREKYLTPPPGYRIDGVMANMVIDRLKPSDGWLSRAKIAHAREAELVAENERLRERVREFARSELYDWFSEWDGPFDAKKVWRRLSKSMKQAAEDAGFFFDDNGNEVKLAEWRARQGGVGS